VTTRPQIPLPPRAEDDQQVYRYWGSQKPPKNAAVLCMATPRLSTEGDKATIRLYGPIDPWGGFWGVSAKEVAEALDGLDDTVTELQLRINSPGGSCWEGLAILNLLRAHPVKVTAVVDGIAASAASFIAAGCDETVMSPGTQMMIHDPFSSAWGCNAEDMRKAAGVLDKIADSMAALYADAAGGKPTAWRAVMQAETWYTAAEAVEAGLAQRTAVVPDAGKATTAGTDDAEDPVEELDPAAGFDLSIFNYAGRDHAPAPAALAAPKPPTASADGSITTQEGSPAVAFSDEQVTNMRQKLGVPENADEATILAALDEALEERSEPTAATQTPEVPEGHVVIPAAKLADLEAGAALATATAAKLANRERDTFLDSVRNKYLPTSRSGWEAEYDRDSEGVKAHFAKAPVLIPTEEIGQGGEPEASADDALYAELFGAEKTGA